MNTVIDTLRFSERLQTSGFAADQANALARALSDELGEQLGTKDDVRVLKGSLDGLESGSETLRQDLLEIRQIIAEIKGDINTLHLRIDGLETRLNYSIALVGLLVALDLVRVVRAFVG